MGHAEARNPYAASDPEVPANRRDLDVDVDVDGDVPMDAVVAESRKRRLFHLFTGVIVVTATPLGLVLGLAYLLG